MPDTPRPCPRPLFDSWLRVRNLNFSRAAALLGCSRETVRRICRPFGDPGRRAPKLDLIEKIEALTEGAVTRFDFVEPLPAATMQRAELVT